MYVDTSISAVRLRVFTGGQGSWLPELVTSLYISYPFDPVLLFLLLVTDSSKYIGVDLAGFDSPEDAYPLIIIHPAAS